MVGSESSFAWAISSCTLVKKKRISPDQQRIETLLSNSLERSLYFARRSGVEHRKVQSQRVGSTLHR